MTINSGTHRIPDEEIAELRARADLVEVINRFGYTVLRRSGASFVGLCPLHDERTPSFNVTPSNGLWFCFGCQVGGDVIDLVQKVEALPFMEAVDRLAEATGMSLGRSSGSHFPSDRSKIIAANAAAAAYFAEQIHGQEASVARTFLADRAFGRDDALRFGVGYAPQSWHGLIKHLDGRGFDESILVAAGLAVSSRERVYDRFRGRLMWPIRNTVGEILGFGARKLRGDDTGPKYLNTPDTAVFDKSKTLYGIDHAHREIRRHNRVVIVEGYFDVMACHLAGVSAAVAACGTAFGANHVDTVRRLLSSGGRDRGVIVFAFDDDTTGRAAAGKALSRTSETSLASYATVGGDGLDPCEYRLVHGDDALRNLVDHARPLVEVAVLEAITQHDVSNADGRAAAADAVSRVLAEVRHPVVRDSYIRSAAGWIGLIDPASIATQVRLYRRRGLADDAAGPTGIRTSSPRPSEDREALKLAVRFPRIAATYVPHLPVETFQADLAPIAQACDAAVRDVGEAQCEPRRWADLLRKWVPASHAPVLVGLLVEPLHCNTEQPEHYADEVFGSLWQRGVQRRVEEVRAALAGCDTHDLQRAGILLDRLSTLHEGDPPPWSNSQSATAVPADPPGCVAGGTGHGPVRAGDVDPARLDSRAAVLDRISAMRSRLPAQAHRPSAS